MNDEMECAFFLHAGFLLTSFIFPCSFGSRDYRQQGGGGGGGYGGERNMHLFTS